MSPFQIASAYFAASILWIFASDQALGLLGLTPGQLIRISVLKGFVFVGVSTWLVYRLMGKARARAEEELRENRAYLDELFEAAPEAICLLDMETRVLSFNQEFTRIFGYEKKEAVGQKIADLIVPAQLRNEIESNQHSISLGQRFSSETIRVRKDGTRVEVSITAAPAVVLGGTAAIHVVYRDLTGRKEAEKQLKATAERLQAILEHAPVGINIMGRDGHIVESNAAYQRITGYSKAKLVGMSFQELTHPEDVPSTLELFDKLSSGTNQAYTLEKRNLRQDGSTNWVRLIVSKLSDDQQICITEDITERKRAEAALEEREQHLRTILQTTQEAFYLVDMQGRLLDVNDAYCALSGYTSEELLQMRVRDLDCTESEQDVAAHMRRIAAQGRDRFETRHRRKDGRSIDIESSVTFRDIGGGRFVCFLRDITERKRWEQELAESEERLRTIVELAPDGILVFNDQGQIVEVNQAASKQLGYTPEQLLQLNILDVVSPRFTERLAARLRGQVPSGSYEAAHLRADGVEIPIELSVTQIVFRGQKAFIAITRDTSDRKRTEEEREKLEQQLRQAQKMEAVGRLAGGIAHDFNNLLMIIQSYTEMLQDSLPVHDSLRGKTREILKAANRAASLTGQMLAFSRKQILSPAVLDLNAVVVETAKMLRRLIGEDIDFQVNSAVGLWAIEADSDQIVQILMNLCVNARDAMPQGGVLTIATGNVTVSAEEINKYHCVSPGDYVRLSVTDTGTGISKEIQERIFEPFFTTKEVGRGTGLGLAMVYGIVKQSGGHIGVDSEIGKGSSFNIYLPRVTRAIIRAIAALDEGPSQGTETILVAEDEGALREAVCGYLSGLGYAVLGASSGQEALSVASEHKGPIDLLITDLVMPRMSGTELAHALASLRPALRTIYMSGYTDDAVLRHGIRAPGTAFLNKPFSLGTLAEKVRDTLRSE